VSLVAAPAGPRAVGVVDPRPPAPQPATPEAVTSPAAPRPDAPPEARPAPPRATPTPKPPPRATPSPPAAEKSRPAARTPTPAATSRRPTTTAETPPAKGSTAPRAGGGPEGGRGTDVANVEIKGLEFPFPWYLEQIVRQVALRFNPPTRNIALQADVAFLIHRDGSVTDIRIVRPSRNYSFDLEARGAVEAAGRAKAFGPLPEGFRDDVLPVTFSFDPRIIR
jgi:TonB family protein